MKHNFHGPPCDRCGKKNVAHYHGNKQWPLICRDCHTLIFWEEKVAWQNEGKSNVVRVGGVHYLIGEEKGPDYPRSCLGFGGHKFRIRFRDGRIVETTNLWCQGMIPPEFKDKLPDNADFLTDTK